MMEQEKKCSETTAVLCRLAFCYPNAACNPVSVRILLPVYEMYCGNKMQAYSA